MIRIKKISAEESYPIRLEVLRKEIDLPFKFKGDEDLDTFHLGAFDKNDLIAVSSFMKSSNEKFKVEQYQLRGMATLIESQGLGAGKLMMQEAINLLKEMNVDVLWCNARVKAVEFYKKQGLQTHGEVFEIPLVGPHYLMSIRLN